MGNTMTAPDLYRVLANGLLFADKGNRLQMIEAVRLEFSTDKVISVATDRFVLGVTRADYSGEEFTAQIDRADAERLAKLAKTAARVDRSVDIEHGDSSLTFKFSTGESVTVAKGDHEFPKFRQLLPTEQQQDIAGYVTVNPGKLVKFTKVIGEDRFSQLTLSLGTPTRPVSVRVGKDFVGIIMPVRTDREGWDLPDWL